MSRIRISETGRFEVGGRSFQIPGDLTPRALSHYRSLLRPIPDIRGGTRLSAERRAATEVYLSRRAVTGVIPGLDPDASQALSPGDLRVIHRWIARHSPAESR